MTPLPRHVVRVLTVAALLIYAAPSPAAEIHAYTGARVWTGTGAPLADGVLLVRDGKVLAVGTRKDVAIPSDATVHELGQNVIIPGLVIAETTLAERGRDDLRALTPQYRAIDGFDFYGDFHEPLSGGVTTVQVSPGSRRLLPGQGAVVKLAGDDPATRTLREREGLRLVLGNAFKGAPRIYEPPVGAVSVEKPLEPTQPQLASTLGGAVAGVRALFRAAREYAPGRGARDPVLEAAADCLVNGQRLRITAPGAADIRAAVALAREFGLRVILVEPQELAPFCDQLAGWKDVVEGVVLSTEVRPGRISNTPVPDAETPKKRQPWENARALLEAGFKVALKPAADDDLEEMLFLAGLFQRGGLSPQQVLQMLTVHPAELLGVAGRVGSLAPGKDADFVVLSGDPFATRTGVRAVYVNGRAVYTAKAVPQATVIQASKLYTGGEVIADGAVLVEGKTIRGVGKDVSAPPEATLRRYPDAVIVPGFIDLATGLGLGGPPGGVSLPTKLGERLVFDPAAAVARQGGVTTVLLGPTNNVPGPVVAFKLSDQPRVVRDPAAVRFVLSGNLTAQEAALSSTLRQAKAYADGWARYEKALADYEAGRAARKEAEPVAPPKAEGQAEAKKDGKDDKKDEKSTSSRTAEPKPPEKPRVVENFEPYRALFAGQVPALVEARRLDAIKLAVKLFRDDFPVRLVLLGADDAFRVADFLAAKSVCVAVGPELVRTVDRQRVNLAQVLANRGVPFGFQSQATTGVRELPLAVQYAVRRGLGCEDALVGLTAGAAKFLSLDGQVGTLAVGRDADLVVLSGPPFEPASRVLAVMIDGQWVYQAEDDRSCAVLCR